MKKKGISLIVLVITIVVIIILAAAVILSLGNNNPIESAKEAKIKTTIDNLKSDLLMSISKITADSLGQIDVTQIDAPGEKYQVVDLIPSIKGTEYENELIVVDGKLKVKEGTTLPFETQDTIKELLAQEKIITSEMIKNDPQQYIGKTVTYTNYSRYKNEITKTVWRIFNVTDAGVIQLIANDYVDLSYKGTAPATNIVVNGYSISSSDNRDTLINYLTTQSNWSEYAVSGKTTSVGVATIEEFCSSYKSNYPNKYIEYDGNNVDGYKLRFVEKDVIEEWRYNEFIGSSNDLYVKTHIYYGENTIFGAWLGSSSSLTEGAMMGASGDGYVNNINYNLDTIGVRPLVSLTNAVLVEKSDGTIVVE